MLLLVAGLSAQFSQAQNTFTHRQKLVAAATPKGSLLGNSVAIHGNIMVMGAPFDGEGGAVYLFEREAEAWVQKGRLTSADGKKSDQFGVAVALSENILIVGANQGDHDRVEGTGAAYVFKKGKTGWKQAGKLNASDGMTGDNFGNAVAISENTIVVGANLKDHNSDSNVGSVYLYEKQRDTWPAVQTQKIECSDGASGNNFGTSVSISGNTLAVGAHFDDARADNAGATYIFSRGNRGWSQSQKLTASDSDEGDLFGYSVSISGNTLAIGAFADDDKALNAGSVYVFERQVSGWKQIKKLTASDPAELDYFGRNLSLSGSILVVGAFSDAEDAPDAGAIYIFEKGDKSWQLTKKLAAPDGAEQDRFGASVAVFGNTIAVGVERDDDRGTDSGSGHIFAASCFPASADSLFSQHVAPDSSVHFALNATGANLTYQWYKDSISAVTELTGQISSQLNFPKVALADSGTYFVTITDACANLLQRWATLLVTPRNDQRAEKTLQVEISPNPSPVGTLRITISGAEGQASSVDLFNTAGRSIRHQSLEHASSRVRLEWDINAYPEGVYFLRVSSGGQSKTLQILH